jgi:Domain of unknown function DUF29
MNTQLNRNLTPVSYEVDYVQWVEETLTQLKAGQYGQVDWPNLFEEIKDMSRRQRDALESNLIVLLLHLLKWQYQPTMQTGSWKGSIREHRRRINKALQTSSSLQPYLLTVLAECYGEARLQAADETGLAVEGFPVVYEYPIDQVLTNDFLPGA